MENENKYTPEGVGWNRFKELCEERGVGEAKEDWEELFIFYSAGFYEGQNY